MNYLKILIITIVSFSIVSCDLTKEVEVELPDYEGRLLVECYLEPGEPMNLVLTRTSPYFDPFPSTSLDFLNGILEDEAFVTITHKGQEYELENTLSFNPATQKIFNYKNSTLVPEDYENDFELSISTAGGETITASTRIIEPTPIDSVVTEFAPNDTLARILVYLTNDQAIDNYYRRTLHESSLDSIPSMTFPVDDRAAEDVIVFGTFFSYAEGDTIINTIYSIDEDYFDFLSSINFAIQSNGNPFAQPSPIVSNVEGTANAIGIFTGLSYDREVTIIQQ